MLNFKLKICQKSFVRLAVPRLTGGDYSASPNPIAGSRGRDGRKREGRGEEEIKGRDGKGRVGEGWANPININPGCGHAMDVSTLACLSC